MTTETKKCDEWTVAIARLLCAVYSLAILHVCTGCQLNILGRFTYLDSLHSLDAAPRESPRGSPIKSIPTEAEKQFLALSHHLLNTILPEIHQHILSVVREQMDPVPLNYMASRKEFEDRMESLRVCMDDYILKNASKWMPAESETLGKVIAVGLTQNQDAKPVSVESQVVAMSLELRYFLGS